MEKIMYSLRIDKKLITTIKKSKPTKDQAKSFTSIFIELMTESGIPP